jgi:hypothetical protein
MARVVPDDEQSPGDEAGRHPADDLADDRAEQQRAGERGEQQQVIEHQQQDRARDLARGERHEPGADDLAMRDRLVGANRSMSIVIVHDAEKARGTRA